MPQLSAADESDPTRKIGFAVLLIFIFLRLSLLHEYLASKLHFDTYLLLVFGALTVLFTILGGGVRRAIQQKVGKLWLLFSVFLILATIFSSWRGGSMTVTSAFFKTNLPGYFGIAGLVCTWRECRKLVYTIAFAGVFFTVMTRAIGDSSSGRLQIDEITSVGNSNDLAAHLLFLIPFMAIAALSPRIAKVIRFGIGACIVLALSLILSTGSRGALIGCVVSVLFVLIRGSGRQRLVFGLLTAVAGLGLFVSLSTSSSSRLATLFTDDSGAPTNEAVGSSQIRQYLLQKSIEFTIEHPLLGLGPGEFGDIEGGESKALGKHGVWQVTHNAFTEISCEAGIPALLCIIAALLTTARLLRETLVQARALGETEMATVIFSISTDIVGLCAVVFFLAMGFRVYFPAITGIGVAVALAAKAELAKRYSRADAPALRPQFRRPLLTQSGTALPIRSGA